jgi:hypothetical protein
VRNDEPERRQLPRDSGLELETEEEQFGEPFDDDDDR